MGSDGLLKRWDVSKPELPVEKQCWPICAPPPASLAITAHKETKADPFPKVTYLIYKEKTSKESKKTSIKKVSLTRLYLQMPM